MKSSCILVSSFAFAYPKISEEIQGARFSSNGLWPDKKWASEEERKGFKYLDGYWDIKKVTIDEILPFHTVTIKDDIEHICVNETSRYANNLPSKSIMLSDIWRFDSISNIYVGLETDIPIKGPDEIGEDFWNNYTISVYSSDCAVNRRYWSAQSFTTQKNEDGSWNIRFIVKSEGGRCRLVVPMASEKDVYQANPMNAIAAQIYSTFGVLFIILCISSIIISLLFCKTKKHEDPPNDPKLEEETMAFTPMPTIPE